MRSISVARSPARGERALAACGQAVERRVLTIVGIATSPSALTTWVIVTQISERGCG
jgi:hypothetical protein